MIFMHSAAFLAMGKSLPPLMAAEQDIRWDDATIIGHRSISSMDFAGPAAKKSMLSFANIELSSNN